MRFFVSWCSNKSVGNMLLFFFQVPAEPLCKNVPGPPVSSHQPDFCTAVSRLDSTLYVWWKPPFWSPGFFLPSDATHACGQRSTGICGTCQICQIVDWNSYQDHNSWVSCKCCKKKKKKTYKSILKGLVSEQNSCRCLMSTCIQKAILLQNNELLVVVNLGNFHG